MNTLLNADDDWIESTRKQLYPTLHPTLVKTGNTIGVPLYSIGTVHENQRVGVLHESEQVIEEEFDDVGRRNPIAALKKYQGNLSEGSWVFLHEDLPEIVEEGMQLHLTLFDAKSVSGNDSATQNRDLTLFAHPKGRVIYAHYEDDWRVRPIAHLREKHFDAEAGVQKTKHLIDTQTFLVLQ